MTFPSQALGVFSYLGVISICSPLGWKCFQGSTTDLSYFNYCSSFEWKLNTSMGQFESIDWCRAIDESVWNIFALWHLPLIWLCKWDINSPLSCPPWLCAISRPASVAFPGPDAKHQTGTKSVVGWNSCYDYCRSDVFFSYLSSSKFTQPTPVLCFLMRVLLLHACWCTYFVLASWLMRTHSLVLNDVSISLTYFPPLSTFRLKGVCMHLSVLSLCLLRVFVGVLNSNI